LDIFLASEAGFCFGVRRALETAGEASERHGHIYSLGPLIHNRQVVEDLAARGVEVVDDITCVPAGSVAMIRTHGAGPAAYEAAEERQIQIIDATCPFVARVQKAADLYQSEGYQVLVLGEADHPEARAIVEHTGGQATIVQGADDIADLKISRRVAVVCQTTQRLENLQELTNALLPQVHELRIANTICDATTKRQSAALEVARNVDLMIVVGGTHSANTTRLAQICAATGTPTHHIETAAEVRDEWLADIQRVGVTAGASTPDEAIEAVVQRLQQTG
jgi:4-hydroxy-3-methylbut-2-enyl diphosphate reductase